MIYISLGSMSTLQYDIYAKFIDTFSHPYFKAWDIVVNCSYTV